MQGRSHSPRLFLLSTSRLLAHQIGATDLLVVGDGISDGVGGNQFRRGMRVGREQTVTVESCFDRFCGMSEKSRKLHIAVAELRDGPKRAFKVCFCNIADAIHLNSVFCHDDFLLFRCIPIKVGDTAFIIRKKNGIVKIPLFRIFPLLFSVSNLCIDFSIFTGGAEFILFENL